ncbi:MAG: arginine--tRNA ligase [Betaproteobacteria bacterium]|nr:arginine--tRNA ligase [Betaproteobacteria bacterium]MBI3936699.1 arginine--tRNA ligase [Betaproteobacteria bacterium]
MIAPPLPEPRLHLTELLAAALHETGLPPGEVNIVLERPKHAGHGDYACNVALQLGKLVGLPPRAVATKITAALPASPLVAKTEIAGPGFINIFLNADTKRATIPRILAAGADFGRCALGRDQKVQVEFVSANPTGPLHVGHGRGAAFGASLANVLAAAGYAVSREYYVNDAGRQMDILALSVWVRYLELAGVIGAAAFPANAYQGEYVRAMAQTIHSDHSDHGNRFVRDIGADWLKIKLIARDEEQVLDELIALAKRVLGEDYAYIHEFALNEQLEDCRSDLAEFGVTFDHWLHEKSLYDAGLVERAVRLLEERGHVYVKDGARWFRSTGFGDEKDRVAQRENGEYTYFASDIAYHLNKFERGFDRVIDVWGADHHGYIARVKGALEAFGLDPRRLVIALVQFAALYRGGKKVPMSTRAGEFVTLRELRREVGNDAARFFYVLRKSDQHLDFDLDLAKSQSTENPVYYVQYAHARVCSVLEQWGGDPARLAGVDTSPLAAAGELALATRLMEYPEAVEAAARELSPHVVAFYLRELAGEFHSYYNATRILVDDEPLRLARLALAAAVRQALRNGLALLGVSAPEKM